MIRKRATQVSAKAPYTQDDEIDDVAGLSKRLVLAAALLEAMVWTTKECPYFVWLSG